MADASIKIRGGAGNAVQIQSRAVDAVAPSDTEVLAWNATDAEWEPTASGGTSQWTDTGTVLHPTESTLDNVVVGGTTTGNSDIVLGVDGAAVFNEQSASVDFRVESNGNDHMLLVDGSADRVGVGIKTPPKFFSASPVQYETGTASQSGTTVTGAGTTWTDAMVGSEFVYADGTTSGAITARGSNTSITVTTSQTVSSQGYKIHYQGLQVESTGHVGIGTTGSDPDSLLHVWAPDESTAAIHLETGGESAADPRMWFHVSGATSYGMGIDNDDGDSFKITEGSSGVLGGNPRIVVQKTTGNVGFGGVTAPAEMIDVDGAMAIKEQSSAPSATADYAKIYTEEYGNSSDVKLLLHMDGSDDGTTFTDSSASTHTVTPTNAVTKTGQKVFGTASAYFDGTGDYLTVANSTDFDFGTAAFTVEFWARFSAVNSFDRIVSFGSITDDRYWTFAYQPTGTKFEFVVYNGGSWQTTGRLLAADASDMETDVWVHLALSRTEASGDPRLFVNGIERKFVVDASSNAMPSLSFSGYTSPLLKIGTWAADNSDSFYGYMDEFTMVKGVGRYTSNFTPSHSAYPVTNICIVDSNGGTYKLGRNW
jgi:hypothetical protein